MWISHFAFTGMLELYGARQDPSNPPGKLQGADEAYGPMTFGNLGAPSLWGASSLTDPEKKKRGLNSEIANGRLAMMAITGMMFQNGYLGSTGPEMWFPSSAFEKELGVQAHTNSHSLNHQSSHHSETPTKSCVFSPDEKDRDMDMSDPILLRTGAGGLLRPPGPLQGRRRGYLLQEAVL